MEFRCPACAAEGHDIDYDHLVVFKDKLNFGCSKYTKNSGLDFIAHRDKIRIKVGIAAGSLRRLEPFISPRKINQTGTRIARHDADLDADRLTRERLQREHLAKLKMEHEEKVRKEEEHRQYLERNHEERLKLQKESTQHIGSLSNKMSNGTFGTAFSFSHQSPSPLIKYPNIPPAARTIPPPALLPPGKVSQRSHFRSWRQVDSESKCGSNEFYSSDFGVAFDKGNPNWRKHYYLWYRQKYYGEPVAL
jgi:hypothetical protein